MAIQRNALFGSSNTNAAASAGKQDKPKAKFWLNVGLTKMVNGEEVFLSLPFGIPLDTQEVLPENSSNKEFAYRQAARNSLVRQLTEFAETMEAGDDTIIDLEVQLRRVKDEVPVSTGSDNPYAVDLGLVTK